ncbi:single-stranded DNA-binding protein 3-like isoform X12 [Tachypleus tridentatus]|uniref:single-stranded DNA-binding protein 3-like isoform X12 n=1 Tax=Tachypleus tridentatus TaxID=6853 RepID=UPI003FD2461A
MYAKGKGSTVPSDAQAREKLALYVYEYLLHVGAQKAAQTFLSEIRWEKNITLGEPPGFLHSWWCVFWDLYCAAPERRDTCEHSSEAKAFHDYGFINSGYAVNGIGHNPTAPSPLGQMPPGDGMTGGPVGPAGFFPPFMSPRYPGRPGVRMGQQLDFNAPGNVQGQHMIPNNMDPTRPGPPGMSPMNPRMNPPRGQHLGQMNPGGYGPMRPPGGAVGPGIPSMSMQGPGGRAWQPNTSTINYSSASPGSHYGPPASGAGSQRSGTPIMPSPQDSSSSGGESMYTMMKTVPGGSMTGFAIGPGPEGPMGQMGPDMGAPVLNGMSSAGEGLDGMKNSPANGPGTPREDGPPMGEYGIAGYGQENDQNESAAILKIKESMQEEAKRFEKDTPAEQPDYYLQ